MKKKKEPCEEMRERALINVIAPCRIDTLKSLIYAIIISAPHTIFRLSISI